MFVTRKIFVVLLAIMPFALCNAAPNADQKNKINYYMSIKGGISLGSYESGVNAVLLNYINEGVDSDEAQLKSFSGASAGSINSLLSAIKYCIRDDKRLIDSDFRNAWDIGLTELLINGEGEASVLSRAVVNKKIGEIEDLVKKDATRKCNVIVTASVTRMKPQVYEIKEYNEVVNLQRFVVPIRVQAVEGGKISFSNHNIVRIDDPFNISSIPSPYIKLLGDENDNLDFETVSKLVLASSAFPVAFEPLPLTYCLIDKEYPDKECMPSMAQTALFSDGGMFDNSPIGVSQDIAFGNQLKIPQTNQYDGNEFVALSVAYKNQYKCDDNNICKFIYINPDHYRGTAEKEKKTNIYKQKVGLVDYGAYIYNSFETSSEQELRSAYDRALKSGIDKNALIITNRYHHLLADFHAHFGAFYAPEFRVHDYIVGVYDGVYTRARIGCLEIGDSSRKCVSKEIVDWINSHGVEELDEDTLDFVKYLYNIEFDASLKIDNMFSNIYIALSDAFPSDNKIKGINVSFPDYLKILSELLNKNFTETDGSHITYSSCLSRIVDDPKKWNADNLNNILDGVFHMQGISGGCSGCENKDMNKKIYDVLDYSEPVVSSVIDYSENEIWPLAMWKNFGLRYAFNFSEESQVLGFMYRENLFDNIGFDAGLNFNRLGADEYHDHYWSLSAGASYHMDSLLYPMWGVGVERALAGKKIYKDRLDSVYLSFGLLNEIVTLKFLKRIDDIQSHTPNTRERFNFMIQIDVSKLIDIGF